MMAHTSVLTALADAGLLVEGTHLEIVPAALPPDAIAHDPRAFRASVGDPTKPRRAMIWELDGQPYSATDLTCRLWHEYAVNCLKPSYFSHWRVVGREQSLWEDWKVLGL